MNGSSLGSRDYSSSEMDEVFINQSFQLCISIRRVSSWPGSKKYG